MATYEFKCLKCKKKFEKDQSMTEEHISDCPFCKSDKTVRIFSIPQLIIRSSAYTMAKHYAPKSRLENMEKVREERKIRKANATNEKDALDNSFHKSAKNNR